MDYSIFQWLQEHHTKFLDQNMMNITAFGSTTIMLSLFAVSFIYLLNKQAKVAIYGLIAVLSSFCVVEFGKYSFHRERPVAIHKVIERPNSPSMPSGHSAMSMTILCVLALTYSKSRYWVIVAILSSVVIGFSRMYLGVHWCTDVLVGWFIGIMNVILFYLASGVGDERIQ